MVVSGSVKLVHLAKDLLQQLVRQSAIAPARLLLGFRQGRHRGASGTRSTGGQNESGEGCEEGRTVCLLASAGPYRHGECIQPRAASSGLSDESERESKHERANLIRRSGDEGASGRLERSGTSPDAS